MATIIKAPEALQVSLPSVFLAGSIEMGVAENWQERLEREWAKYAMNIFNPRRDDWDSSWTQSIDNAQFREQVEWELKAMRLADIIVVNFDPTTKSPITLMELGLWAGSRPHNVIVHCPEGFWRKGNVDILCRAHGIQQVLSIKALIQEVPYRLGLQDAFLKDVS